MRIAICTPVYGDTKAGFTRSLAELLIWTTRERPDLEITFQTQSLSILPLSRTHLASGALAWRADWILWLDADQTFPRDTLVRLLAHDLPIVGCNILTRRQPLTPTAIGMDEKPAETTAAASEKAPLVEVHSMGLGVALVRSSVFRELPQPWFETQVGLGSADCVGEDYYFFRKVRKNGDKVFIDQKLSLQIGHIGETEHRFTG